MAPVAGVHVVLQAVVPLHKYAPQLEAEAAVQVPPPLQRRVGVEEPDAHVAAAQMVETPGKVPHAR